MEIMTSEQALKMAKAELECIERQTSGKAELCNNDCESCSLCYEQGNMGEQKEWLKMAIKALENQCPSKGVDCEDCSVNEPCEDCISRQAVLDYIEGSEAELGHSSENELVCQNIKALPPIQPKEQLRIKARWIRDSKGISHCSKCAQGIFSCQEWFKYCPNCGTEMSEDKE